MDYNNKYKKFPAARQAMALQIQDRWMDYLPVHVLLRISRSFGTQLFIQLNIYFTCLYKMLLLLVVGARSSIHLCALQYP